MIGLFSKFEKMKWYIAFMLMLAVPMVCPLYAEDLLLLRPSEKNFEEALGGIKDELGGELSIYDYIIDKDTSLRDFESKFNEVKPKMIILMEGKSVTLYKKYQNSKPSKTKFPPAFVLMTVYAKERIRELKNATGLQYEIQAVTSLSSLRVLLDQPLERVGVLYSSNLRLFFREQQRLCANEKIELVGIMIDEKTKKLDKTITRELKRLIKNEKVDAIWILNDNTILKDVYLEWSWVPQLKRSKLPVVVSLERLLRPLGVGHFAIVPDHLELGTQAARMILSISDNDWEIDSTRVRAPIGTAKKIDTAKVPKGVKLNATILREEWIDFSNTP